MRKQKTDREGPVMDRFMDMVIVFCVCFASTYGIWGLTSMPTIQLV